MVAEKAGSAPVLVLDDVLSELDPLRSAALLRHLPAGQVVLTTAGVLPEAAHPDAIVRIADGTVAP
jgi:DNA replication and repair protein RecF